MTHVAVMSFILLLIVFGQFMDVELHVNLIKYYSREAIVDKSVEKDTRTLVQERKKEKETKKLGLFVKFMSLISLQQKRLHYVTKGMWFSTNSSYCMKTLLILCDLISS